MVVRNYPGAAGWAAGPSDRAGSPGLRDSGSAVRVGLGQVEYSVDSQALAARSRVVQAAE